MKVYNLYQLTEEDVNRADLDKEDVGRWCIIIRGTYQIFNTEEEARDCLDFINNADNQKEAGIERFLLTKSCCYQMSRQSYQIRNP